MAKAAVLIDWQNIRGALRDGHLYRFLSIYSFAMKLRNAALEYFGGFVGEGLDSITLIARGSNEPHEVTQLMKAGVDYRLCEKNADPFLLADAFGLIKGPDPCRHFVIASGDQDFLPLETLLKDQGASVVAFWPATEQSAARTICQRADTQFLDTLLGLARDKPHVVDQVEAFVLRCHRLIDDGVGLWSYTMMRDKIARAAGIDPAAVEEAFEEAKNRDWIAYDIYMNMKTGTPQRARRLAYEAEGVRRVLLATDIAIAASTRARGMLLESQAVAALNHPLIETEDDRQRSWDAIKASGYLRVNQGAVSVPQDPVRVGVLRPLHLAACACLAECPGRKDTDRITQMRIAERFVRYVIPGGARNARTPESLHVAEAQGRQIANRALAAGILFKTGNTQKAGAIFGVRWNHPLVEEAYNLAQSTLRAVHTCGMPMPQEDFSEHITAQRGSSAETYFWTSALAAVQLIYRSKSQIALTPSGQRFIASGS